MAHGAEGSPSSDGTGAPRLRSLFSRFPGEAPGAPTYWLTRFLVLRLLGLVYFVAFLSLAQQVLPLIGSDGLLPARLFLERAAAGFGGKVDAFLQYPSLFWLGVPDALLQGLAWVGVSLSLLVLLGYANALLLAVLWALYLSFVHVGQDWYSYGWEIQLLETGFLAIFLCPLLDGRPFPRRAPQALVIGLLRWLIFRIMVGAGLIKMRGDSCWRDLTCLYYHYETQPIPNPLSRYLHFFPRWFHRGGALYNHLTELVAPWFAFGPRVARHSAGLVMLVFQAILILSGNLSFLNWLTIVPVLACFDDSLLKSVVPSRLAAAAERAAARAVPSEGQRFAGAALALVVAALSVYPVLNLVSQRQVMNTSFDSFHLVNTYGAFGVVGRERREIVFEGTDEPEVREGTRWREYEFRCKPGSPTRRPCVISPYHYRLDWQIWFAAMSTPDAYPWTVHLVWKLLHNDGGSLSLLAENPFPDRPPRFVRALLYRYEFVPPRDPSPWWRRTLLGTWIPPLSVENPRLRAFLAARGWLKVERPALARP